MNQAAMQRKISDKEDIFVQRKSPSGTDSMQLIWSFYTIFFLILGNLIFAAGYAEEIRSDNLYKFAYSKMENGKKFPGYLITAQAGDSVTLDNQVFYPPGGPSVKLDVKNIGHLYFDSPQLKFIDKDKQYLLTLKVKVEGRQISGHWWQKRYGLWIRIYNVKSNEQTWCNIAGNGNTDQWVTMILPFRGARFAGDSTKLLIRCDQMSGTVWVQDPVIIELPDEIEMKRSFLLHNGQTVVGSHLTIQ